MFSTGKYIKFKCLLLCIFVYLVVVITNPVYADTSLFTVTNGGAAQTITNTSLEVTATVQSNNSIQITATNTVTPALSWSVEFIAAFDKQLLITNYEDAKIPLGYPQSTKSLTKPGMIVLVGNQQCDRLTGRFDVLKAVYDSSGYILQLAIDFVQNCVNNSITTTSVTGALRHNITDLPLQTIDPIAIAGADQHLVELNIIDTATSPITFNGNQIFLDASNSSAGNNATISQYSWKQISGPTITLSDTASITPDFSLPAINLTGDNFVFELTITNSNSIIDTDQITIFVTSKSAPQTSFFFESDTNDYIGNGQILYADTDDAIFVIDNAGTDHAHIQINDGLSWHTDFGITPTLELDVGLYQNTLRHIPNTVATTPVMHIKNAKRGCTTISGNFEIIQINRNINNTIQNLKIDFEQHCNEIVPAIRGFIKFNYIDIKVPIANAGITQTEAATTKITLDASRSSTNVVGSVTYKWLQLSGTPVTLSNDSIYNPTFIAPNPANGINETLEFKLIFSNSENFISEDTVNVIITPKVTGDSSIGGGGGGCSINNNAKFDITLYLLLLIITLVNIRSIKLRILKSRK